jgi:hypothetical protein
MVFTSSNIDGKWLDGLKIFMVVSVYVDVIQAVIVHQPPWSC